MFQNCPFWLWLEPKEHEREFQRTHGKCCFWHIIGEPEKEHLIGRDANGQEIIENLKHPMMEYEKEWYDAMQENRYLWVKKATGMGATTFFLGYMVWLCLRNDDWKDATMGIVTGPRLDLAKEEIGRIPALFKNIDYRPRTVGASITLNGCKITAYPSHTFDTARGLERVRFWFVDEADFFPQTQQLKAKEIVERYEAKSHPYVIFNSTANLPGGLYETMEREESVLYTKVFSLVDKGIRDGIYSEYEISEARKSSGFAREYEGQYGIGIGNIFNYELLDDITVPYDLSPQGGIRILNVDPAFGNSDTSSKFGIVGFERRDGIMYVTDAEEHARPSPEAMLDYVVQKFEFGKYHQLRVDSAHPGLVRDWNNGSSKTNRKAIPTTAVVFSETLVQMTVGADTKVKEKQVRIHPTFRDLIAQLKAVEFNEKGTPDKKKLNFDLGDAFIMGLDYWRAELKGTIIKSKG